MGGPFGVAGDWQDGVSLVGRDGGSPSLRGDACMSPEKQEEVRQILRRRQETPSGAKVRGSEKKQPEIIARSTQTSSKTLTEAVPSDTILR